MVPTVRKVRREDPNGFVKGVITMFEVVDFFQDDMPECYSAHYTETEAEDAILDLIHL